VLAYVFWHRPRDPAATESYEQAQIAFHHSLSRSRPVGMCGSASFRVAEIPWLAADISGAQDGGTGGEGASGYEDWYLLEDYTALGVLNEAAVGHGHRTLHDEAARRFGAGAGGLYGLIEGERVHGEKDTGLLGDASLAVWVSRPVGSTRRALDELLGDGMDPRHASLWRRQLVFGPAPEFCLLSRERTGLDLCSGVAATRLPEGWTARTLDREVLWNG
jgi:hypothetical protein